MRPIFAAPFFALLLAACGDEKPSRPVPPPPPSASDVRVAAGSTQLPRGAPKSVTFRQIMLIYRLKQGRADRTRADAYALAKSLIDQLRDGAKMALLLKNSDDRESDGRLFNSGSVTLAQDSPAMPVVMRAAFSTPVGQVAPEPIDTGFAFLVLFRDA